MEYRDLYDENKTLTGDKVLKGEDIPKGKYYITVVVWIQNFNGKFLLQQRVVKKDNKWATTGGHPITGQTSEEGVLTEIKEELGLSIEKGQVKLFKTIKTEDDFVDLYYLKMDIDIDKIILQEEEVQKVGWFSKSEIEQMIIDGIFSSSHEEFYGYCLEYLSKN